MGWIQEVKRLGKRTLQITPSSVFLNDVSYEFRMINKLKNDVSIDVSGTPTNDRGTAQPTAVRAIALGARTSRNCAGALHWTTSKTHVCCLSAVALGALANAICENRLKPFRQINARLMVLLLPRSLITPCHWRRRTSGCASRARNGHQWLKFTTKEINRFRDFLRQVIISFPGY